MSDQTLNSMQLETSIDSLPVQIPSESLPLWSPWADTPAAAAPQPATILGKSNYSGDQTPSPAQPSYVTKPADWASPVAPSSPGQARVEPPTNWSPVPDPAVKQLLPPSTPSSSTPSSSTPSSSSPSSSSASIKLTVPNRNGTTKVVRILPCPRTLQALREVIGQDSQLGPLLLREQFGFFYSFDGSSIAIRNENDYSTFFNVVDSHPRQHGHLLVQYTPGVAAPSTAVSEPAPIQRVGLDSELHEREQKVAGRESLVQLKEQAVREREEKATTRETLAQLKEQQLSQREEDARQQQERLNNLNALLRQEQDKLQTERQQLAEQRQQLDRQSVEQRQQLDRQLAEQRQQLDRQLAEQRQQLDRQSAEQRQQQEQLDRQHVEQQQLQEQLDSQRAEQQRWQARLQQREIELQRQIEEITAARTPPRAASSVELVRCSVCNQSKEPFELMGDELICSHVACVPCIISHFQASMDRPGQFSPVRCWDRGCNRDMSHRLVRAYVPARYDDYMVRLALHADQSN